MAIELSGASDDNVLKMHRKQLTGSAKWRDIEDLINRWARRNPLGAREQEAAILHSRAELKDKKFAKSGAEAMGRHGVSIHPELMSYIQAFYPHFLETKDELREFMRKFPKFRISEKV